MHPMTRESLLNSIIVTLFCAGGAFLVTMLIAKGAGA